MDGTQRLVRGREVAFRVARAAPEDRAGPPGAAGHEMALSAARARYLERELVRWRRAVLLDVGAVRVAVAANERPEPAALDHEHAPVRLAARGAQLAGAGEPREIRLFARERSRLFVLRIERAGEEPSVAAQPDHHGVSLRADLVGRLGGEVLPTEFLPLLVHQRSQRRVKLPEERYPGTLSPGDLIELFLHPGREREVHVAPAMLHEEVGDDLRNRLRVKPALPDRDVAPVHDRREGRRVGGR